MAFLDNLNLEKIISTAIPIILLIFIVFFFILYLVLNYHWHKYEVRKPVIKRIRRIYLFAGLSLLIVMVISQIIFAI